MQAQPGDRRHLPRGRGRGRIASAPHRRRRTPCAFLAGRLTGQGAGAVAGAFRVAGSRRRTSSTMFWSLEKTMPISRCATWCFVRSMKRTPVTVGGFCPSVKSTSDTVDSGLGGLWKASSIAFRTCSPATDEM